MKTREEIIKEVEDEIKKYNIWADITPHMGIDCIIDADVDGDWKHDHLAIKQIFKNHGCSLFSEQELGASDCDCYHSIHHYIING